MHKQDEICVYQVSRKKIAMPHPQSAFAGSCVLRGIANSSYYISGP